MDAYLVSTRDATPMRLGKGMPTALSADGGWVLLRPDVVTARGEEASHASPRLLLVPTGAGEPRVFAAEGLQLLSAAWTPDGKRILLVGREAGGGLRVFVQAANGKARRAVTPGGVFTSSSRSKPVTDGRRVVVQHAAGRLVFYALDDDGQPRPVPGVGPGFDALRFADEGRSLLVAEMDVSTARIYRIDLETSRRTLLHEITPPDTAGVTIFTPQISADARSYAYGYRQILHRLYLIEGLR